MDLDILGAATRGPGLPVAIGAAVLALLAGLLIYRRVRKAARGKRADDVLGTAVMVIGLGWSSEAMWELATDRLGLPVPLAALLFLVFEAALLLSMMRAKRALDEHGWTGRYGKTAWIIAAAMGAVAALSGSSFVEAMLRLVVPLVVTKLWWDGLIGEKRRPEVEESSWTITPAKLLVKLRLRRPGKESLEQVNRDYLIERMTRLEFQLRFAAGKGDGKLRMKLARLSVSASRDVLDAVRARVALADTYIDGGKATRVRDVTAQAEAEARAEVNRKLEQAEAGRRKAEAEAEAADRKRKQAEAEVTSTRKLVEAEAEARAEVNRKLAEAEAEVASARKQAEAEAAARAEAEVASARKHEEAEAARRESFRLEQARQRAERERQQAQADLAVREQEAQAEAEARAEAERRKAEATSARKRKQEQAEAEVIAPTSGGPFGVGMATIEAIRKLADDDPEATQRQLAERAGVSDRTVRHAMNAIRKLATSASGSGS